MAEANTSHNRVRTLLDGRTAPVVRIDDSGMTLDGEPLPLIIADDPIEVTVTDSAVVSIRLTLLSCGPTIIDKRTPNERVTTVSVAPVAEAAAEP